MNRIRGAATALLVAGLATAALLAGSRVAYAQETTGRVTGRVNDKDTGAALPGVTVIVQGTQGEDATITNDKGDYEFSNLPVGHYAIRFYVANTATQVEQPDVLVSADKTVRVNAKIAGAAAAQQVYVITGKAPAVDVGSTRVGATFGEDYTRNVPNGSTYGDIISRAPGAFVDPSGNVSIGGSTGLENIYVVNGLNVTGMEYGNLDSGAASLGGGTNLPVEFLTQIDVSAGGYQAEFGGAMGGVINTVLKTGTNQLRGSVFGYWSPYWLAGEARTVTPVGSSLGGVRRPDFDTNFGVEVGGPIIKDRLFFWVGFSPRLQNNHVFRLTYAQTEDPMNPGHPQLDASGQPVIHELTDWRARINETHQTYSYAGTLDFTPNPDNRLTLAVFGSPNFNNMLRNTFNGADISSNPAWAQEALTKVNTDVTLKLVSKQLDRHWIIEGSAGVHSEHYDERSPNDSLNSLNQLEYWGSNLWDLEHAPGCQPDPATGFQPCPVNPNYHTGGFGLVKTYTGNRWMGEVKSTNLVEAGGHHELKYGWRMEYGTFDQDRYYSGPPGQRSLIILAPYGGAPATMPDGSPITVPYFNQQSLFTLRPGQFPTDFGSRYPLTDLLYRPDYQDDLKANVSSLSNSFFLQEAYSPDFLRNLTVNVGARLELQKMTDTYGNAFLDTKNLGPRLGAVYDPMNDGRSKVSVSYGRYFEAIPMNLAARYFGGEGIFVRNGVPLSTCAKQNAYSWTGAGEWANCPIPPMGNFNDVALGSSMTANNGSDYPVQAGLKGQYHNEVVATVEREIMDDLTLRLDYIHRWLGEVIEDGSFDPSGSFVFVLANPGDVPQSAVDSAQNDVNNLTTQVKSYMGMDQNDPNVKSQLANAQSQLTAAQAKLANLKGLQAAPKPERTYDAITLSLNKRFSRAWFMRASYTYSRLIGNYEGLYQFEQNYFAPNGSNFYDTPDLRVNQKGPLPNDRPHQGRIDGYYTYPVGHGQITTGLSFFMTSGMPRNYISALIPGQELVMLLPRGSGGRTPLVTEFDGKLAYGQPLSPNVNFEAFIDFFNIFNQQASLQVDDNYTFDMAAPIVNGTPADLKFAKNLGGQPVAVNPNYGRTLVYQTPFHARLGMRLTF
jgi:hypothetical protein